MLVLHHHPFCPRSRFARLALAEHRLDAELVEEHVWDRRRDFLEIAPEGTTPVLVEDKTKVIVGSLVIAEYLEDTPGPGAVDRPLWPTDPVERAEARRLTHWFDEKFHREVSSGLVTEKIYKRVMPSGRDNAPDMETIRASRANLRWHLRYIDHLIRSRNWLAGDRLTYADLAAAAHLSCLDYLSDVPWDENETAKNWYARVKSRPSFRALLTDRMPGMVPSPAYADLDF